MMPSRLNVIFVLLSGLALSAHALPSSVDTPADALVQEDPNNVHVPGPDMVHDHTMDRMMRTDPCDHVCGETCKTEADAGKDECKDCAKCHEHQGPPTMGYSPGLPGDPNSPDDEPDFVHHMHHADTHPAMAVDPSYGVTGGTPPEGMQQGTYGTHHSMPEEESAPPEGMQQGTYGTHHGMPEEESAPPEGMQQGTHGKQEGMPEEEDATPSEMHQGTHGKQEGMPEEEDATPEVVPEGSTMEQPETVDHEQAGANGPPTMGYSADCQHVNMTRAHDLMQNLMGAVTHAAKEVGANADQCIDSCKDTAEKKCAFQFTALTKVSCPSGTGPIFSEATCKTAMKALTGKSVSSVGKACWHKHPQGCFTHYPKNKNTGILMNNPGCGLKSGTTHHDTAAICAGGASKAPQANAHGAWSMLQTRNHQPAVDCPKKCATALGVFVRDGGCDMMEKLMSELGDCEPDDEPAFVRHMQDADLAMAVHPSYEVTGGAPPEGMHSETLSPHGQTLR